MLGYRKNRSYIYGVRLPKRQEFKFKKIKVMKVKAKNQKEIKGIYYNEKSNNVFFVNYINDDNKVIVSTVLVNRLNQMYKVLDDKKIIPLSVFWEFNHSGNYKRQDINN